MSDKNSIQENTQLLDKEKYCLWDIFRLSFRLSPGIFSAIFLLNLCEGLLPTAILAKVSAHLLDTALGIFRGGLPYSAIHLPLWLLLIVIAALSCISSVQEILTARLRAKVEMGLLPEMIKIQGQLAYAYLEDSDAIDQLSIVASELEETFMDAILAFLTVWRTAVALLSVVFLLLAYIWWAALVFALAIPLLIALSLWFGKIQYEAKVDTRSLERRYSYYSDAMLCNREAAVERTLFHFAPKITADYAEAFDKASRIQLKVLLKTKMTTKLSSIVLLLLTLGMVGLLLPQVHTGRLSPGLLIGLIQALLAVAQNLGGSLQNAAKNLAEGHQYMQFLSRIVHMEKVAGALQEKKASHYVFQELRFEDVTFTYPNSQEPAIQNLTFSLQSGKHYAFVGANGAGKSTLIQLLLGLYPIDSGKILIDGKNLEDFSHAQRRALFSVVFQDPAAYPISLRDNLTLGNPKACSELALIEALKAGNLEALLLRVQGNLEQPLGKIHAAALDLSGGQWQKIAIARAFLNEAPIRILDEPTSALDPLAESQLYERFQQLMQGKTAIFITHRLASIHLADEIFVLDHGRLVEEGTHQALLELGGLYQEMYEKQQKWYEEAI